MICNAIKTRALLPPQDDLFDLLKEVPKLSENTIVCVASKVVAIHQGRTVSVDRYENKDELITQEADFAIPRDLCPGGHMILTVNEGSIIGSAGIDASNGKDHYILWPKNSHKAAWEIRDYFLRRDGIKNCGVIILDSHSSPLRRGATGFSLGFAGFAPLKSYVGKPDIFNRNLKSEVENIVDALAASASVVMGEGNEQTPVAIISDVNFVEFDELDHSNEVVVPLEDDTYYPLTKVFLEYKVKNIDQ